MIIIGDVHGKVNEYKKIIDGCDQSICVGDFGFKKEWDWYSDNVDFVKHRINPGNHDYGPYLTTHVGSTGDWEYFSDFDLFTIRGAKSIDQTLRIEGISWFANEQLTYSEGLIVFDKYCELKPKIVVSHDAPHSVIEHLFKYGWLDKSNTTQLLQRMFEEWQPELWVFGHHHQSKDVVINGTRFICLNELETFKL